MTRDTLLLTIRFVFLLLLQVLVLNNVHFLESFNPQLYLLFVFLYPLEKERGNFIFISFLFGMCLDFFSNSGGINAAATVCIAYLRLPLLKLILNKYDLDYKLFHLMSESLLKVVFFIALLTFIHHSIFYLLDYFSFKNIGVLVYKVITASVFTIILSILVLILFDRKKSIKI
jgi:rod shape-determining protein MreD